MHGAASIGRALVPALAAMAAALLAPALGLDFRLADALYAWRSRGWPMDDGMLATSILHEGSRAFVGAVWVSLSAWLAWAWRQPEWRGQRRAMACLLASVLVSTLLVSWLKSRTNMDCPWDLSRYGGMRDYVGLFETRPPRMPDGRCFPAGHASGGYAWMALYFYLLAVRPAWRLRGLTMGIALGLVLGIAQQLRGAHFLSHDLWTAGLCWAVAVGVHALAGQPLRAERSNS
jgi:membrane-associated PAP2 superfamily phosphatase